MSRSMREAKMKALQERKSDGLPVVITERGGRKRDRKKILGQYAMGSLPSRFPPPPSGGFSVDPRALQGLTVEGSGALRGLMNPNDRFTPQALRGMTSQGSLGHMFAGGGDAATIISGGGGMAPMMPPRAVPLPAPTQPRSGPDWHGLRTPGMGELRQAPAGELRQAPAVPASVAVRPNSGWSDAQIQQAVDWERAKAGPSVPGHSVMESDWKMGPGGRYKTVTATGQARHYDWSPYTPEQVRGAVERRGLDPTKPFGFEKGSLPSYQGGSLPNVPSGFSALPQQAASAEARGANPGWMLRKMMNAPTTLAGLGLGVARGATFGPGPGDTIIAEYEESDPYRQDAQTLGEVILRRKGMLPGVSKKVTEHELGHVEQGKFLGPLLPAAAGAVGLVQALRGRDPYLENLFETTAPGMGAQAMMRESRR